MYPTTSPPASAGADFVPVAGAGGLPKIALAAADGARAELYLHGAHVTSWIPAGEGEERLFLSSRSQYVPGVPIRGGVPVSFPQFASEGPLPKHGFARITSWQLIRAGRHDGDAASALLRLTDSDATRALWPHRFLAELTVTIAGRTLEVALVVNNNGEASFTFTGALHTYLRVADVREAAVRGLQHARYRDSVLDQDGLVEPARDLRIVGEIDRVYHAAPEDLQVREPARTMAARGIGFPDTVIWNPGERGGAALKDLEPGGFARMLCVEAAVVRSPVTLKPGERWSGMQTLTA